MTDVREFFEAQAQVETDKQADLRRAKEEIAGPVPLIPDAPDVSLNLQRGLLVRNEYKTEVIVRELTGADEEALARTKEATDFFDMVIALGVVSVGDFDLSSLPVAERQGYLRTLLIGERDQIFLAIVKATFGERKTMTFSCQTCQEDQEIDLLLSEDFKPQEVKEVTTDILTYQTSKGDELQYRLVTGEDQLEAFARKNSTTPEQNTIILSRVITKRNNGLIPDPLAFVRSMPMRDRQNILAALVSHQPTIDLMVTTKCAACGADQPLILGWVDLFRP